ncbi:MAG TPA: AmmeMemoRadiSam system protein B [Burkholderiaceae bacterium]|nr:AmmeMemoRadiSam system protein B [Burkholderiaceae bacterium]
MNQIRPPAVAGLFYPDQPRALRATVDELVAAAEPAEITRDLLKVLIVPHAGYVYSGPVAAAAYALLKAHRQRIRRVILLGPTHRVAIRGVAIPDTDAFATPLGTVELDRPLLAQLAGLPHVVRSEAAHADEHSLEVQVPFLQTVLGDFTLVPLAVGEIAANDLAAVLDAVWGGDETLILVSSDLSHYHRYGEACAIDRATVERVLALHAGLDHAQACGATPINAALTLARRAGLQPRLLKLCNSGDTAGDRARVVGYCAIAFERPHDVRH